MFHVYSKMSVPPNYNIIYQNPNMELLENVNKIVYDQSVAIQPTISFLDAYALMPSDNPNPIAVGSDIAFPNINSTSNSDILPVANSTSSFTLGPIGVYDIYFQVGVTDVSGCQLVVTLNNVEKSYTVSGLVGSNVIVGRTLMTTTVVNSVVTIRNPAANARSAVLTPSLGGNSPISAHLIITRLR